MNFKDILERGKQAYRKLMDRPNVEPVNKELFKDYKPVYVDWSGDENCEECFDENCNTCSINLAHKYNN